MAVRSIFQAQAALYPSQGLPLLDELFHVRAVLTRSVGVTRQPGSLPASDSWASSVGVRRSMMANRRVDTRPERRLRSHVHRSGMRFRKDFRIRAEDVSVRVDMVFIKARVAVFVDGCFWHQCPEHATMPKRHVEFWRTKLLRNVERDRATDRALTNSGWTVIRCWEHEEPSDVLPRIASALRREG
jgi:DNA mismatch endonuclease (patch repair protein)